MAGGVTLERLDERMEALGNRLTDLTREVREGFRITNGVVSDDQKRLDEIEKGLNDHKRDHAEEERIKELQENVALTWSAAGKVTALTISALTFVVTLAAAAYKVFGGNFE